MAKQNPDFLQKKKVSCRAPIFGPFLAHFWLFPPSEPLCRRRPILFFWSTIGSSIRWLKKIPDFDFNK
jgi:hypothetical protein